MVPGIVYRAVVVKVSVTTSVTAGAAMVTVAIGVDPPPSKKFEKWMSKEIPKSLLS